MSPSGARAVRGKHFSPNPVPSSVCEGTAGRGELKTVAKQDYPTRGGLPTGKTKSKQTSVC